MKTIKFHVSVIECNAEKFEADYMAYIDSFEETAYGNVEYILDAPLSVYEEIESLAEEGIEIV